MWPLIFQTAVVCESNRLCNRDKRLKKWKRKRAFSYFDTFVNFMFLIDIWLEKFPQSLTKDEIQYFNNKPLFLSIFLAAFPFY